MSNFVLMHDKALPHIAYVVQNYIAYVGIITMAWPTHKPHLNPIEHIWDILGRCLRR